MRDQTELEKQLVALLRRKQIELGLSDRKMAARLGISRELWNKTKLEKKMVRAKLLHGIVRAFPEYTPECLDFLRRNGTPETITGQSLTESTQTDLAAPAAG